MVKYISDQVMVMNDGEIVEMADSDEIYRNPHQPYTQTAARVDPEGLAARRVSARGYCA